MLKTIFAA